MNLSKFVVVPSSFLMVTLVALSGCATSAPKEAAKLVSRVEESRRALQAAEAQIRSTLDAANSLGQTEGGSLQSDFQRLNSEIELSNEKRDDFGKRVASMDKTSASYFTTWAADLDNFQTEEFRTRSEARLEKTRGRYNQLMTTMQQAEEKFNPFMAKLHDVSRYLNFMLNPTGVASIKTSVGEMSSDATDLYTAIETAVQEADGFAALMGP
jgi:chromosome segregation ATPase